MKWSLNSTASLKWEQCDQGALSEIVIRSQIPWCKTLKAVPDVPLQIAFSLHCRLVLCGGGRRYHFQYCRVLVLTANGEWLSWESSHGCILWGKDFWDSSCGSNGASCLLLCPPVDLCGGLGAFPAGLIPRGRCCRMKLCRGSFAG